MFDYIFWFKIWMCIGAVISTPTYCMIYSALMAKDINDVNPKMRVTVLHIRYNRRMFGGKVGSHAAGLFVFLGFVYLFLKDSLLWPVRVISLFK